GFKSLALSESRCSVARWWRNWLSVAEMPEVPLSKGPDERGGVMAHQIGSRGEQGVGGPIGLLDAPFGIQEEIAHRSSLEQVAIAGLSDFPGDFQPVSRLLQLLVLDSQLFLVQLQLGYQGLGILNGTTGNIRQALTQATASHFSQDPR
ncbi:hypothetical protein MKP05_20965, partial [Halomonas sp. EGI 63088]